MTVTEVRDRLNDRFRLLVGSRRGLERHQTLRHAVQWSYDLLDQDEQMLLNRCSVFAGGFDLAGACAVAGSDDEFATLDVLDALVRKSLLVADRSSGRTRFSMLETIRQFAEDQLAADGSGRSGTRCSRAILRRTGSRCGRAVGQSAATRGLRAGSPSSLPNLRAAFRWAADRGDLDTAATIAQYAFLGALVEQYEPVGVGRGTHRTRQKPVEHRRLAALYVVACQCCWVGQIDEAIRLQRERSAPHRRRNVSTAFRFGYGASLGGPYIAVGQPNAGPTWLGAISNTTDDHGARTGRPWLWR